MSRREFSSKVKRLAYERAGGRCENLLDNGERCPCTLGRGKFHYDHDLPDWMGGEPTLENCVVLCIPCHREKTSGVDIPTIAKAKRIRDREIGIVKRRRLRGRGFDRPCPQRSASRPIIKRNEVTK